MSTPDNAPSPATEAGRPRDLSRAEYKATVALFDAMRENGLSGRARQNVEAAAHHLAAEARSAALSEVEGLIVDAPCRHAADFGAGPDVDPGPCLTEIDDLLAAIQALQEKSA